MPRTILVRPPGGATGRVRRWYAVHEKLKLLEECNRLRRLENLSLQGAAAVMSIPHTVLVRWTKARPRLIASLGRMKAICAVGQLYYFIGVLFGYVLGNNLFSFSGEDVVPSFCLSAGARLFAFWGPLSIFGWLSLPPPSILPSLFVPPAKEQNKISPSKFISSFSVKIELSILLLVCTIRLLPYFAAQ